MTSFVILLMGLISDVPLGNFALNLQVLIVFTREKTPIFLSNMQLWSSLDLDLATATKNIDLPINILLLHNVYDRLKIYVSIVFPTCFRKEKPNLWTTRGVKFI